MTLTFQYVLGTINRNYDFTPTWFRVVRGEENKAGENEDACRVLAFSADHRLNKEQTLRLFAEHYQNVLDNPKKNNHRNIRLIDKHGLDQVQFGIIPLKRKPTYNHAEALQLISYASQR